MTQQQERMDKMLLCYAAGSLSGPESFMVAALLAFNPEARQKVDAFERLGGKLMQEETPAALSSGCLEAVLQKISAAEASAACTESTTPSRSTDPDSGIPQRIRALVCEHCGEKKLCWRPVARGIKKMTMPLPSHACSGQQLQLLHMKAGHATPAHRHAGTEITLVLSGAYSDSRGIYRAGDIEVIDDPTALHSPKAGPEGCLCLVLTEAPLRFQARFNRFLNLFIRF